MRRVEWLYVLTFAVATVHVVDSAYWHEWEMLSLPGGIELFLLESLALAVPFLVGLSELAKNAPSGPLFGVVLAALSMVGVGLHGVFLARGGREFRTVASVTTLTLMLAFSVALMWESVRLKRLARSSGAA